VRSLAWISCWGKWLTICAALVTRPSLNSPLLRHQITINTSDSTTSDSTICFPYSVAHRYCVLLSTHYPACLCQPREIWLRRLSRNLANRPRLGTHPSSRARACELRSLASLIAMFKILSFGRMFVSVNLLTFGRKFFSTPAGYKPPPEPKSTKKKDKEDVEMSILTSAKMTDYS